MITTQSGFWDPLLWLAAFIVILVFVYIIRAFGNKHYEKNSQQTEPFQSGNVEEIDDNVAAGDVYWGFTKALKGIYTPLRSFHTGIINDYVGIFTAILALLLIVIALI